MTKKVISHPCCNREERYLRHVAKKLCRVHLVYKADAWNSEDSRRGRATTAKKCTKKRDAGAKLLFYQYEPIDFLPFSFRRRHFSTSTCLISS